MRECIRVIVKLINYSNENFRNSEDDTLVTVAGIITSLYNPRYSWT